MTRQRTTRRVGILSRQRRLPHRGNNKGGKRSQSGWSRSAGEQQTQEKAAPAAHGLAFIIEQREIKKDGRQRTAIRFALQKLILTVV